MKRLFFPLTLAGLVILFTACTTTPSSTPSQKDAPAAASTTQGDGSSFDSAIAIHEKDESSGVDAEYKWIRANIPGFRPAGQTLSTYKGKPYDIIHLKSATGQTRDVYFDISECFGKL